jgi:hypothetical protein
MIIAAFVTKGSRLAVDGIACTVTAVFMDGSAFIARDDLNRILTVRNDSQRSCYTLSGRQVEVRELPRKNLDELIAEAREWLRSIGLYPQQEL